MSRDKRKLKPKAKGLSHQLASSRSTKRNAPKACALGKARESGQADAPRNLMAAGLLLPVMGTASIVKLFNPYFSSETATDEIFGALTTELAIQCKKVGDGDLMRVESMLVCQSHSLDMLFNHLALRARRNMDDSPETADRYLRLALKAQGQCRATLETLATIKNPPPVAFVRQANIANGPQQVNNGDAAPPARAEVRMLQNEQSRLTHEAGQQLDIATSPKAIGQDPRMETLAAIDRTQDGRGKGPFKSKRVEGRHSGAAAKPCRGAKGAA